jgi:outer membrane protein TolC
LCASVILNTAALSFAQSGVSIPASTSETPITVTEVVETTLRDYPQIHLTREELNSAVAQIQLARTAYLPQVNGLFQANRATRNNVIGALLPQNIIPSMSGPVLGTNNSGSVWGSAAGLLVIWRPFDFGLRHATVEAALAGKERATAATSLTELEVSAAAVDAYMSLIAAKQTEKASLAAVNSWDVLLQSIHALTASELRPGADESRVQAERAAAATQLALARQATGEAMATLIRFLPRAKNEGLQIDSSRLLSDAPPIGEEESTLNLEAHPAIETQKAAVAQSAAELHATEREWVPRFDLEGAGYARGTGAEMDGGRLPGANGLAPTVGNYAAGISVTFPFMDFASIHAREAQQAATLRANQASLQLADKVVQEQFSKATAALMGAREVAANTPIELKAAQTAFDQAKARYRAGLSPIDDLAQAQRLLVQAEIDDSLARLNVWRAILQLEAARGSIQPFLQLLSK